MQINPLLFSSRIYIFQIHPKKMAATIFWEELLIPLPFFNLKMLVLTKKTLIAEPLKLLNLLPKPPKALDIWRIKGEDLDLHPH
jgi:hypothetical protein